MAYNEEIFGTFYEKGEVVCRQGEPGDTMYIIQSGAVEVSQLQGGQEVVLGLMEAGDFFGEMALVDEKPRSATVTVIKSGRLLYLTRETLLERVRQDPGVAIHLLRALSRRIEETSKLLQRKVEESESLRVALEKRRQMECQLSFTEERRGRGNDGSETFLQLPLSAPLDIKALARAESVTFDSYENIFRQGDPGEAMYIIAQGAVEIYQEKRGVRCFLTRLGRGDIFGEMALLTSRPRSASAVATERCQLVPIMRSAFFNKVKRDPGLALYVLQVLTLRLRRLHQAMADPEKWVDIVQMSLLPPLRKEQRIRMALVSLSTCGSGAAVLLEDQQKLGELLERVRIVYCPMLMDQSEISEADIVAIDGAVRMREDEELLREVRYKSDYLVAWGTCAAQGGIPSLANMFELEEIVEASYGETQDPFDYYLSGTRAGAGGTYQRSQMALLRRAGKLDDFVRVDYYLPGCPARIDYLIQLVKELRGEQQSLKLRQIVCAECSRKPRKVEADAMFVYPRQDWDPALCFSSGASLCLGFLTKGGCGAICPSNGLPCWGCRGPSAKVLKRMKKGETLEQIILSSLRRRCHHDEEELKTVMRILRSCGYSLMNFSHNMVLDPSRIR
ncbi:MAG: cyclic nucleotide-binding domain-containing protein [Deltaproteobacteria bacterium]|nr:cyclic nucleotide-binding domain-containing protein [Deltaproteobacteria bacterium]MBW2071010.1 cyclic nucleotide-binding domain-containing protein [Deltaproteobacteria bacterium]